MVPSRLRLAPAPQHPESAPTSYRVSSAALGTSSWPTCMAMCVNVRASVGACACACVWCEGAVTPCWPTCTYTLLCCIIIHNYTSEQQPYRSEALQDMFPANMYSDGDKFGSNLKAMYPTAKPKPGQTHESEATCHQLGRHI